VERASNDSLRALPPMHTILASGEAAALGATLSRDAVRDVAAGVL
jgi:hypothetical protein